MHTSSMLTLFEYQKRAVVAMKSIESCNALSICHQNLSIKISSKAGILADATGSGKTVTMLSLINELYMKTNIVTRSLESATRMYGAFVEEEYTMHPQPMDLFSFTTVIVVNPNITEQWAKEATKVLDQNPSVLSTQKQVRCWVKKLVDKPHDDKVVILNENRFRMFAMLTELYGICFARIVYDESRHMRIIYTQMASPPASGFSWFISASPTDNVAPENIFCNTTVCSMMYSMDDLPRHVLQAICVRTPIDEIEYPGTIEHIYYEVKTLSKVTDIILDQLPRELSARIASGDIHGAISILGAEPESDIYSVALHRINHDIRQVRFSIDELRRSIGIISGVENRISDLEQKERVLIEKKEISEARFHNLLSTGTCSICLDNFEEPVLISCCSNVYCSQCITRVLVHNRKCPMCRSINFKLHRVASDAPPADMSVNVPEKYESKIDVIKRILSDQNATKIVIYSEFDNVIQIVRELANEIGFNVAVLSGFQTARVRALENFKKNTEKSVLFASAMTDCSGIDLPETTDIILWHKLNSASEQQVIGRTRRVSTQSDHCTRVHHLYKNYDLVNNL